MKRAAANFFGACLVACLSAYLLPDGMNAWGAESVRTQEINECRAGEVTTWGDGQDQPAIDSPLVFTYDHTLSPEWFSSTELDEMLKSAAMAWAQCGVPVSVVALAELPRQARWPIRVQWNDLASGGNFGLANLTQRTLSLGPKAFELLKQRNPAHDARQTLQMVLSHEMGHFFGLLDHSRRCVDVLSYYHNGKGDKCFSRDPTQMPRFAEYRHVLPTACDIQRCQKINGMAGSLPFFLSPVSPSSRGNAQ